MQRASIQLLVMLALLALPAQARYWIEDPQTMPAWDVGATDLHLGCADGSCAGYGDTNWADEVQVSFQLPAPPFGGPWKIEYAAFFLAGPNAHVVYIREGTLEGEPGAMIADNLEFLPISGTWPPSDWTYVSLCAGSTCPDYLIGEEGDVITLGVTISGTDVIGLAPPEAGLTGWGFYEGSWTNDSVVNGLVPAIRLGISDLGLSVPDQTTWGRIKELFAE